MAKGKASLYKDAIFSCFETHGELLFQDGLSAVTFESYCEAIKKALRVSDLTPADIS
jgi:hypothetical protein